MSSLTAKRGYALLEYIQSEGLYIVVDALIDNADISARATPLNVWQRIAYAYEIAAEHDSGEIDCDSLHFDWRFVMGITNIAQIREMVTADGLGELVSLSDVELEAWLNNYLDHHHWPVGYRYPYELTALYNAYRTRICPTQLFRAHEVSDDGDINPTALFELRAFATHNQLLDLAQSRVNTVTSFDDIRKAYALVELMQEFM